MSKFLAILKDSFYETIDFKLFYVLIGISLLLSVVVLSFPFPKLPVDQVLQRNLNLGLEHHPYTAGRPLSATQLQQGSWLTASERHSFTIEFREDRHLSQLMLYVMYNQAMRQEMTAAMLGAQRNRRSEDFSAEPSVPGPGNDPASQLPKLPSSVRVEERFAGYPTQPASPEEWQTAVAMYVAGVIGIDDVQVRHLEMYSSGVPRRAVVEARLNWAEMPYSRQVGFLFGVWKTEIQEMPLSLVVWLFFHTPLITVVAGFGGIIISLVVTAGFIPNMLQKGTIDFLLVKPISRPQLLAYKYLGGLFFVLFNAFVLISGTWLAFGFTSGVWSLWYLASIFTITFYFAILYALSAMIGVLTRSQLACILISIGFWFFLVILNRVYVVVKTLGVDGGVPEALLYTVEAIHWVLPKPSDLSYLNDGLLLRSTGSEALYRIHQEALQTAEFSWTKVIGTSLGFIAVMHGIGSWRFCRKDY
jgi:ABC-type transport system involved in multi-copper enzyme maturation permease subunit